MNKSLLIFALSSILIGASPESERKSDTPFVDLTGSLDRLKPVLELCRQNISSIDIDALPVSYKEGKIIQEHRKLCLEWLVTLSHDIYAIARKQTLIDDLQLLMDLKELDSNLDALCGLLASPISYDEEKAVERSLRWAEGLLKARESLRSAKYDISRRVGRTMIAADAILAECRSRTHEGG